MGRREQITRGHEAFAEFPLRRLVVAAAQVVEDGVEFVEVVAFHPVAGGCGGAVGGGGWGCG